MLSVFPFWCTYPRQKCVSNSSCSSSWFALFRCIGSAPCKERNCWKTSELKYLNNCPVILEKSWMVSSWEETCQSSGWKRLVSVSGKTRVPSRNQQEPVCSPQGACWECWAGGRVSRARRLYKGSRGSQLGMHVLTCLRTELKVYQASVTVDKSRCAASAQSRRGFSHVYSYGSGESRGTLVEVLGIMLWLSAGWRLTP